MSDPRALYSKAVLDHSKQPRNAELPEGATHRAERHNPVCGDRMTIGVVVREGRVAAVGFTGFGCAICVASASAMTEAIKGATVVSALAIGRRFIGMVERGEDCAELGELSVFREVGRYPVRISCATLGWLGLREALGAG